MGRTLASWKGANAVQLQSGYCYEYQGDDWETSSPEDWDIEITCAQPGATYLGTRGIDGATIAIFECTDGVYRGQMLHFVQ